MKDVVWACAHTADTNHEPDSRKRHNIVVYCIQIEMTNRNFYI